MAYVFEAHIANELHGQIMPCVANDGPIHNNLAHQSCAGVPGGSDNFFLDISISMRSPTVTHTFGETLAHLGMLVLNCSNHCGINNKMEINVFFEGTLLLPRESTKSGVKRLAVKRLAVDEESQSREKERS